MAVVSKMELGRELSRTVVQINAQIDEVKIQANKLDISAQQLRGSSGDFVLAPLLAAKAQCLHGLAIVNDRRS